MKRDSFVGLTLLVFLLFMEGTNAHAIGFQTGGADIAGLIAVLRNDEIRKNDPSRMVRAIEQLGNMRATAAIDDLVKYITFRRTYDWEHIPGVDTNNEIHTITPAGRYPAIGALFSIGKPSLPFLAKVIEENESETLASENATYATMMIFGENVSEAVGYFTQRAAETSQPVYKRRLLVAAENARKYVK